MIQYNQKIFLTNKVSAVEVDYNVKKEVVLSHIISYLFNENIETNQPIDTSNILFVTDDTSHTILDVFSTALDEEFCPSVNKLNVKTVNVNKFKELTEKFPEEFTNINTVILGFVNVIPPILFHNVLKLFESCNIIIFGDPNIENQEYGNYFARYLTNKSLSIKLIYDVGRFSPSKKINNLVHRLRKDCDNLFENTLNNAVDISQHEVIRSDYIAECLNNDRVVVVPKRIYGLVMSKFYESEFVKSDLDLTEGMIYHTKRPYLYRDKNVVIPAYTKIKLINIDRRYTTDIKDGDDILIMEATLKIVDDTSPEEIKGMILENVLINMTDYFKQFAPNQHPEQFDIIMNEVNKLNISVSIDSEPEIMKITPFKILNTVDTKYINVDKMTAFIETVERDIHFSTDSFYYNHFARVKDDLVIFYSDEFEVY